MTQSDQHKKDADLSTFLYTFGLMPIESKANADAHKKQHRPLTLQKCNIGNKIFFY